MICASKILSLAVLFLFLFWPVQRGVLFLPERCINLRQTGTKVSLSLRWLLCYGSVCEFWTRHHNIFQRCDAIRLSYPGARLRLRILDTSSGVIFASVTKRDRKSLVQPSRNIRTNIPIIKRTIMRPLFSREGKIFVQFVASAWHEALANEPLLFRRASGDLKIESQPLCPGENGEVFYRLDRDTLAIALLFSIYFPARVLDAFYT